MRPAGIFADVSADGAGALAGRIGRVEIAVGFDRQRHVEIHHARLHHGALIGQIDFKNPVHARKGDHDSAGARDGAAAQAGSRAAADDGNSSVRGPA